MGQCTATGQQHRVVCTEEREYCQLVSCNCVLCLLPRRLVRQSYPPPPLIHCINPNHILTQAAQPPNALAFAPLHLVWHLGRYTKVTLMPSERPTGVPTSTTWKKTRNEPQGTGANHHTTTICWISCLLQVHTRWRRGGELSGYIPWALQRDERCCPSLSDGAFGNHLLRVQHRPTDPPETDRQCIARP